LQALSSMPSLYSRRLQCYQPVGSGEIPAWRIRKARSPSQVRNERRFGYRYHATHRKDQAPFSFLHNGSGSGTKGLHVNPALIDVVGAFAAMLTTSAFFPQAIKTIRTRDTAGLSLTMYALLIIGVSLWLVYGLVLGSWPLILANGIVLVPQSLVMTMLLKRQLTK
jgi:MtN3 and saliva related transmembrane protein